MPPKRKSRRISSSPYARGHQLAEADNPPSTSSNADQTVHVPPQDAVPQLTQSIPVHTSALLQPDQPGVPRTPITAGIPISTALESNVSIPLASAHDELSLHVPKSVKEKIWNGEYIDISVLLNKEPSALDAQKLVHG